MAVGYRHATSLAQSSGFVFDAAGDEKLPKDPGKRLHHTSMQIRIPGPNHINYRKILTHSTHTHTHTHTHPRCVCIPTHTGYFVPHTHALYTLPLKHYAYYENYYKMLMVVMEWLCHYGFHPDGMTFFIAMGSGISARDGMTEMQLQKLLEPSQLATTIVSSGESPPNLLMVNRLLGGLLSV